MRRGFLLVVVVLALSPARAAAQLPVPTPTVTPTPPAATPTPAPTPPPSVRGSHVVAKPEVGAGGHLTLGQKGLTLPARLQKRGSKGNWHAIGKPLRKAAKTLKLRAPNQPTHLRYRAVGADGFVTKVRVVRVRYLRLAAAGDVNLGDGPGTQIALHGFDYPWASVGKPLRQADIAFANLECPVSTRGTAVVKEFTFRGQPGALRAAARKGGLDVVNLANNHSGDYGDAALLDTIRYAHQDGLTTVGAGKDAAAAYKPRYVKKLGLRIAFVGFSAILPYEFAADAHSPGDAWASPDRIRSGVERARKHADIVIATFHWGIEREFQENAQQRALAHLAIQAGATAVIAGHPHVQQPIVKTKRHVIAFSLGNFVFSANTPGTESTGILHLALARHRVAKSHFQRATIVNSRPLLRKG